MRCVRGCSLCLVAFACLGMATATPPQAPGMSECERMIDRQLYEVLRVVINTGAELYNADALKADAQTCEANRASCYRFYHGSLMTVRPLLSHHVELQKSIDLGFAKAERLRSMGERAYALRGVLDEVRARINPATSVYAATEERRSSATIKASATTLWERLGGEAVVRLIVDDFVALAIADTKINFFRSGKFQMTAAQITILKERFVAYISSVTEGTFQYSGRGMRAVHQGMAITEVEYSAFMVHMRTAFEAHCSNQVVVQRVMQKMEETRREIVETGVRTDSGLKLDLKKGEERKLGTPPLPFNK